MSPAKSASDSTALIIGASRGLGLALAQEYHKRGWRVIGTVRGGARSKLHDFAATAGDRLEIETVDITAEDQIKSLAERLKGRTIDLLFVNAGVANDLQHTIIGDVSTEEFTRVMLTNALSPMRVVEWLKHLVPAGGSIAAMSSGLGSVANNDRGGWEVYRASKAALNTLMRSFAAREISPPRSLFVIAPGWVRTDMGGPAAPFSVDESIPGVVNTIAAHAGKPGLLYIDHRGQIVPW
jgi:NAD(P)-dependent dehydrogenase (short-subunit alcohol dehydrogenase family)